MVRLVCAVLLLAVATASASERIVGGFPTTIQNYPAMVQVQRSKTGVWSQYCAGVVLTSRYILSSARCFSGPDFLIALRRVLAGSTWRNGVGQARAIVRVVKHPLWNQGLNFNGDIAVVELISPLQFTDSVRQASILGQGVLVPENWPATQVGWGMTFNEEFPSIFAKQLQRLGVMTFSHIICRRNYATLPPRPLTVTNNMLCSAALYPAGACVGDRGGPLLLNSIVVGIVSWGLGCTNATFPTVHTLVPAFTNWIVANVV